MKKIIPLIMIAVMAVSLCACAQATSESPNVESTSVSTETAFSGEFTVVEKHIGYDGGVPKYHVLLRGEGYALSMIGNEEVFALLAVNDVCHGDVVSIKSLINPYGYILTLNVGELTGNVWKLIPVE